MLSSCPAERTLKLLEGRWKIFILHHLFQEQLRYGELRRAVQETAGPVSQKMLTQELRALEQDQLVVRIVMPGKTPQVLYKLTDSGRRLRPVLESMIDWGYEYELAIGGKVRQPSCSLGTRIFVPPSDSEDRRLGAV
jgi:DNA-binding HxlR family transcriptional regulator